MPSGAERVRLLGAGTRLALTGAEDDAVNGLARAAADAHGLKGALGARGRRRRVFLRDAVELGRRGRVFVRGGTGTRGASGTHDVKVREFGATRARSLARPGACEKGLYWRRPAAWCH